MVRLFFVICLISSVLSTQSKAEMQTIKPKPLLSQMEGLFSLIKALRRENSELKDQLMVHETVGPHTHKPAALTPSEKDPSVLMIDKAQYEMMVKEMDRLKKQNLAKEKMLRKMEQGL